MLNHALCCSLWEIVCHFYVTDVPRKFSFTYKFKSNSLFLLNLKNSNTIILLTFWFSINSRAILNFNASRFQPIPFSINILQQFYLSSMEINFAQFFEVILVIPAQFPRILYYKQCRHN